METLNEMFEKKIESIPKDSREKAKAYALSYFNNRPSKTERTLKSIGTIILDEAVGTALGAGINYLIGGDPAEGAYIGLGLTTIIETLSVGLNGLYSQSRKRKTMSEKERVIFDKLSEIGTE